MSKIRILQKMRESRTRGRREMCDIQTFIRKKTAIGG